MLVVSATAARMSRVRPYDPIAQTMSVLAASGRGEWIMTGGIALSAVCQMSTGWGLHVLSHFRGPSWYQGLCGMTVAAFPASS
ncbi:DUF998 domain-containing protein [Nocardia sp. AB354]|uniref:DUF998 domain-containing protein n=1 Tax=Nocardia sp. AB354 TaxID=3413283 RepID=UPI003C19635C